MGLTRNQVCPKGHRRFESSRFRRREYCRIKDMENALRRFGKFAAPAARVALFVIYFWFGLLKLIGLSPAESLVRSLFERTIPFVPFSVFYIGFSLFECVIGILFLIPKATRVVIPLFLLHMITTFLPLIFLPQLTWQAPFALTLEGQYIMKNLALIALAMVIAGNAAPPEERLRQP
jgi:uncharacterized membrane protein YphA (DoxX/SURF4 family)